MLKCHVTHKIADELGANPADVSGSVEFIPDMPDGSVWTITENGESKTLPAITTKIDFTGGEYSLELFAAGENSLPSRAIYWVNFTSLIISDMPAYIEPFRFETIPGGEVDLSNLVPVAGTTPPIVRGPQGPPGADGADGPQGPPGADGQVTFESLTPEQINQITGPQGPPGADGADGPQGPPGADGADGPQGPPGADGQVTFESLTPEQINQITGPQGPPGADGADGPQGPPGPPGADGSGGDMQYWGPDRISYRKIGAVTAWGDRIGGDPVWAVQLNRIGRLVSVSGQFSVLQSVDVPQFPIVGDLPPGYAPLVRVNAHLSLSTGEHFGTIRFDPSGVITMITVDTPKTLAPGHLVISGVTWITSAQPTPN